MDAGDRLVGEFLEDRDGHGGIGRQNVDEVVPHQRPLIRGGFGRARIHADIEGTRIGIDDLDRDFRGQRQRQTGLAGTGRTGDDEDGWLVGRLAAIFLRH